MGVRINSAKSCLFALIVSLGAAGATACGGKITYPICGDGSDIQCLNNAFNASKGVCSCTASGPGIPSAPDGGPLGFNFPVCLPPDLNVLQDADTSDVDPTVYGTEVGIRCNHVADGINGITTLFFPNPCGAGGPIINPVACQPSINDAGNLGVSLDLSCNGCNEVDCVKFDPTTDAGNCKNPLVGNTVDPTQCNCNTINVCGGHGEVICRSTPGSGDPPVNAYGILPSMLSGQSLIQVGHPSSTFTLTISLNGEGGGSTTVTPNVGGGVRTWGVPHDDGTADVIIDFGLTIDDMDFSVGSTHIQLTNINATGGTGAVKIHFDAAGNGMIPATELPFVLDFVQTTQHSRLMTSNTKNVPIKINFAAKTFSLPSLSFDNGLGISGSFALIGTIIDQPPIARTNGDQKLECTSPQGATATLDGSGSTDPDNNVGMRSWALGSNFDSTNVFSGDAVTTVTAPIGTTLYTFTLADGYLQASQASETITVRDTTPPNLTLSASPSCLWPPNSKFILFQLGSTFGFNATDTCDPNPSVTITDVTSDQPAPGEIVFGPHAFCLQSARDGSISAGRHYAVTVQAQDKYGNTTTKNIVITVPHAKVGRRARTWTRAARSTRRTRAARSERGPP